MIFSRKQGVVIGGRGWSKGGLDLIVGQRKSFKSKENREKVPRKKSYIQKKKRQGQGHTPSIKPGGQLQRRDWHDGFWDTWRSSCVQALFYSIICFVLVGIKYRALHMLGKCLWLRNIPTL